MGFALGGGPQSISDATDAFGADSRAGCKPAGYSGRQAVGRATKQSGRADHGTDMNMCMNRIPKARIEPRRPVAGCAMAIKMLAKRG